MRLLKNLKNCILFIVISYVLFIFSITINAENSVSYDIVDVTLEENISQPVITSNAKDKIVSYMRVVALGLQNKKLNIKLIRNGEVIVITEQSDNYFSPNSTSLKDNIATRIDPIISMLKTDGDKYKVIIAVHSDDTGSEEYTEILTEERGYAIYEYMENSGVSVSDIVFYPMGSTSPLYPNNSIVNRRLNRRIEIYLIPNKYMIDRARANKLR